MFSPVMSGYTRYEKKSSMLIDNILDKNTPLIENPEPGAIQNI